MSDVEKIIAEAIDEVVHSVYPNVRSQLRDDADEWIEINWTADREILAARIRSAFDKVRAAGYEVAKVEWEYAVHHVKVDGWGDFQHHKSLEDAESDFETCGLNCTVVRRRKAGVWQPVEGEA